VMSFNGVNHWFLRQRAIQRREAGAACG
jgi:hypothetical protein